MMRVLCDRLWKRLGKHSAIVEFHYNNSYHARILGSNPFEATLWSRKVVPFILFVWDLKWEKLTYTESRTNSRDHEKKLIPDKAKDASRSVSKERPSRYIRFGKRGKLNPRYVGPFKVIERVGEVAYKLELPEELSRVH
ncbi:hypothetical protein Tco_1439131 [Tanacetum coccineum]